MQGRPKAAPGRSCARASRWPAVRAESSRERETCPPRGWRRARESRRGCRSCGTFFYCSSQSARLRLACRDPTESASRGYVLREIRGLERSHCTVPDVENLDHILLLEDPVDHAINMGLAAVEQIPQPGVLGRNRTAFRQFLQAENSFSQAPIPFQGRFGVGGVDLVIDACEITLGTSRNANLISHAFSQTLRRTAWPGASSLFLHPPCPDGFLPGHRPGLQYRAGADRPQ